MWLDDTKQRTSLDRYEKKKDKLKIVIWTNNEHKTSTYYLGKR